MSEDLFACRHCGASFRAAAFRDLHVGHRHADRAGPDESAACAAARAAEETALATIRRHVRSGFVVLPLFLLYVFVAILLAELDGNPAFIVMVTPGFVIFGVLMYAMWYARETARAEGTLPRPGGLEKAPPPGRP